MNFQIKYLAKKNLYIEFKIQIPSILEQKPVSVNFIENCSND